MSTHQLILLPRAPDILVAQPALVQALRDVGLIGERMAEADFHKPGEEFLYLLTFLGCSPVVSLGEPGPTADFCRVQIPAATQHTQFVAGANVKPPRCPKCSHRFEDWQARVTTWRDSGETSCTCPACGHTQPLTTLSWRQSAGFARTLVRVWGIFEGEAVPGEKLMGALETVSGGPWTHLYYRAD